MSSSSNLLLRSSTYDRILNVAAECLLLKGYRETRMNHIAEMAGLSRAGLYKHFPTKDSILLELNKRLMDEALEDAKAVSASKDCSLDVIRNWLTKYLDYQQSNFVRAVMVADAQQRPRKRPLDSRFATYGWSTKIFQISKRKTACYVCGGAEWLLDGLAGRHASRRCGSIPSLGWLEGV